MKAVDLKMRPMSRWDGHLLALQCAPHAVDPSECTCDGCRIPPETGIMMRDEMVVALHRPKDHPLRKRVTRRTSARWAKVKPGTILWVRECHAVHRTFDDGDGYVADEVYYRATPREGLRRWIHRPHGDPPMPSQDYPHGVTYLHPTTELERGPASQVKRWTPAVHMPRWAARTWLRVTSVDEEPGDGTVPPLHRTSDVLPCVTDAEARLEGVADRAAYLQLWREINGENYPDRIYRIAFEEVL